MQHDGLPVPRRWIAVLALSLGVIVSVLVNSVVNIALPALGESFRASVGQAVWIVSAYQLAAAVALLPMAAWGERRGYLRVYQVGLAIFILSSIGCAASPSLPALLAVRVLQGIGAAGVMAVNTALLRAVYPVTQLGRGLGLNAMVVAVAAAAGPTLGGGILAFCTWPFLFLMLASLAALAMLIGWFVLVDAPRRVQVAKLDGPGVALQALTIAAFILGIGSLTRSDGHVLSPSLVILAMLSGTIFVRREVRLGSPLMPVDLLRQRVFALSFAASLCSFVAQTMALIALPFSLHRMGFDAGRIGLLLTPWPLAVVVTAPVAGALSDRWSAAVLGSIGLTLASLALALLAELPADGATAFAIVWRIALCGIGFGLFSAPNVRTLVAAAPVQRSGAVGAMIAISRQVGQALGAALAGLFLGLSGVGAVWICYAAAAVVSLVAALLSVFRRFQTA